MEALHAADPGLVFWLLAALHIGGLASMFLARLTPADTGHEALQHLYIACLVVVGCATIFTICAHHSFWVWSGTTFSLMAVGATLDLGSAARARGF